MATLVRPEGIPNIILIGLPNISALRRAEAKLCANGIPHYAWSEPDYDFGFTAIATTPIHGEQRKALANYRVYSFPVAQNTERQVLTLEDVGGNPTGEANGAGANC
jgi:hypothetical protein